MDKQIIGVSGANISNVVFVDGNGMEIHASTDHSNADVNVNVHGIETQRGEIIDIDGNHFEIHYIESTDENLTSSEVLTNDESLVRTITVVSQHENEGTIQFQHNIIHQDQQLEPGDEAAANVLTFPKVEADANSTVLENSSTLSTFQQPEPDGTQIFQLGNSGQFIRLAVPDTEDPLSQHQFYLSDASTGQFIKLPDEPINNAQISCIEKDPIGLDQEDLDKEETSDSKSNLDPEIEVVTLYDGVEKEFSEPKKSLQKNADNSKAIPIGRINYPPSTSSTVNVVVPGGLSVELMKYIFTSSLCRVCLLVKDNMVSLFDDVFIGATGMVENNRGANAASRFNIIAAIKTLVDVDVGYGDALPDHICMDCLDNLTAFSIFRKKISLGQTRLSEIITQVKGSAHPTIIPPLGEIDISKTGVFRFSESIICAKKILNTSRYSHFVVRRLSDRIWDKIFISLGQMVGFKSGKLKELEHYSLDSPFVTGWFCAQCNITIHGPREVYIQHFQEVPHAQSINSNSNEIRYPCDICGKSFETTNSSGTSENYAEHWIQHFFFCECDICGKRMPSMKGVWVHKRSVHITGDRMFPCRICEKTFFKKVHLVNHEKTHLNPEERKNFMSWCSICNKHLIGNLSVHMSRVHSDSRPWKCELCSKTFKRKEILNGHLNSVHSDAKRYQCEICGEFLKSSSTKTLHVLKHKGEKPHGCDICDKRFYTSSSLKSHIVKHKESADIVCTICQKAFKRKLYLVEHMRLHTGEKPHECPICGKKIRMKSNYFKHLGIHKKRDKAKLDRLAEVQRRHNLNIDQVDKGLPITITTTAI